MAELIHAFNELGLDALDPRQGGGRPRWIDADDRQAIVKDVGPVRVSRSIAAASLPLGNAQPRSPKGTFEARSSRSATIWESSYT